MISLTKGRKTSSQDCRRTKELAELEIHFGKPVIARVRKCRTVVVRNKRQRGEERQ